MYISPSITNTFLGRRRALFTWMCCDDPALAEEWFLRRKIPCFYTADRVHSLNQFVQSSHLSFSVKAFFKPRFCCHDVVGQPQKCLYCCVHFFWRSVSL